MNIEVPEFLIEMSNQIREQDNRMTAEPLYEVRCKRYIATEEDINESHWELHAPDGEGHPAYSTRDGADNCGAHDEFYDHNEVWCMGWLRDNEHPESLDSFVENFDFEENSNRWFDWPEGYSLIHMQEIEETVKTCLTEYDANCFINRKQHDYPKLYTYVTSMVFCPQMIELRNWILSLSEASKCSQ
jgi:hypothetical protein